MTNKVGTVKYAAMLLCLMMAVSAVFVMAVSAVTAPAAADCVYAGQK